MLNSNDSFRYIIGPGIFSLPAIICALTLVLSPLAAAFERTGAREPCSDCSATRRPVFGDLHVHTRYSFTSYVFSQRNDPGAAYRCNQGEAISLSEEDPGRASARRFNVRLISLQ